MKEHLFKSSGDGALYDTRVPRWHEKPPLRPVFEKHFREITNTAEFRACLRAGAYAWPGGYPLYFVMADGEPLSFKSVRENIREITNAFASTDRQDQWRPVGLEINYEDSDLICAHSGEPIPAAYEEESNT